MNKIDYEDFYLKYRKVAKSYAYGILNDGIWQMISVRKYFIKCTP